jgi:hypothetical protein
MDLSLNYIFLTIRLAAYYVLIFKSYMLKIPIIIHTDSNNMQPTHRAQSPSAPRENWKYAMTHIAPRPYPGFEAILQRAEAERAAYVGSLVKRASAAVRTKFVRKPTEKMGRIADAQA